MMVAETVQGMAPIRQFFQDLRVGDVLLICSCISSHRQASAERYFCTYRMVGEVPDRGSFPSIVFTGCAAGP